MVLGEKEAAHSGFPVFAHMRQLQPWRKLGRILAMKLTLSWDLPLKSWSTNAAWLAESTFPDHLQAEEAGHFKGGASCAWLCLLQHLGRPQR